MPATDAATAKTAPRTLDLLPVGTRGTVVSVDAAEPSLLQRLLEMGVLEGEPVEVTGLAPLGDPIRVRLRDYELSLRRREARCVVVAPDPESRP